MRGVTLKNGIYSSLSGISTHTPHARRDFISFLREQEERISTHTPHARRD